MTCQQPSTSTPPTSAPRRALSPHRRSPRSPAADCDCCSLDQPPGGRCPTGECRVRRLESHPLHRARHQRRGHRLRAEGVPFRNEIVTGSQILLEGPAGSVVELVLPAPAVARVRPPAMARRSATRIRPRRYRPGVEVLRDWGGRDDRIRFGDPNAGTVPTSAPHQHQRTARRVHSDRTGDRQASDSAMFVPYDVPVRDTITGGVIWDTDPAPFGRHADGGLARPPGVRSMGSPHAAASGGTVFLASRRADLVERNRSETRGGQSVPASAGCDDRPCGYPLFGPPYHDLAAGAGARGWLVGQIPGNPPSDRGASCLRRTAHRICATLHYGGGLATARVSSRSAIGNRMSSGT
jgi:hypothetical protein